MSVKALPNLLSMGTLALLSTMEQRFQAAVILILAGGVLDLLDGRVDRRLKAASCLGRELDSLADLVSFGVAPAILAIAIFWQISPSSGFRLPWLSLYAGFSAWPGSTYPMKTSTLQAYPYP